MVSEGTGARSQSDLVHHVPDDLDAARQSGVDGRAGDSPTLRAAILLLFQVSAFVPRHRHPPHAPPRWELCVEKAGRPGELISHNEGPMRRSKRYHLTRVPAMCLFLSFPVHGSELLGVRPGQSQLLRGLQNGLRRPPQREVRNGEDRPSFTAAATSGVLLIVMLAQVGLDDVMLCSMFCVWWLQCSLQHCVTCQALDSVPISIICGMCEPGWYVSALTGTCVRPSPPPPPVTTAVYRFVLPGRAHCTPNKGYLSAKPCAGTGGPTGLDLWAYADNSNRQLWEISGAGTKLPIGENVTLLNDGRIWEGCASFASVAGAKGQCSNTGVLLVGDPHQAGAANWVVNNVTGEPGFVYITNSVRGPLWVAGGRGGGRGRVAGDGVLWTPAWLSFPDVRAPACIMPFLVPACRSTCLLPPMPPSRRRSAAPLAALSTSAPVPTAAALRLGSTALGMPTPSSNGRPSWRAFCHSTLLSSTASCPCPSYWSHAGTSFPS